MNKSFREENRNFIILIAMNQTSYSLEFKKFVTDFVDNLFSEFLPCTSSILNTISLEKGDFIEAEFWSWAGYQLVKIFRLPIEKQNDAALAFNDVLRYKISSYDLKHDADEAWKKFLEKI